MKILTLSTYPVGTPAHGGQHRVANIVRVLREAGHEVQTAGVLGSDQYAHEEGFCAYPGHEPMRKYIANPLLMEDWAIGRLFADDHDAYSALASLIEPNPDLILIENPWLFDFAKRFVSERKLSKTALVYSSENIESQLRYDIVAQYLTLDDAVKARDLILETELKALREAHGVCGVSQEDLAWMQARTSAKCILAQNGVARRATTAEGLEQANRTAQHRKIALLCGSAHPPNITGFFEMFGAGVGCIAPDESLVLVGGVGPSIVADPRFHRTAGLARATISAGVVSEACLQGLLAVAHTIILPITHGGGTNLKTAEALWAGKNVVATSVAMRGFDAFTKARGVSIADDSRGFVAALREAMAAPPLRLTHEEQAARASVLWDETLRDLVDYVAGFAPRASAAPKPRRELQSQT
ncbi:glycosyltransferase [Burkholderia oklahomensis]|uniref:Glycosyl transferases group 1 family protein n=1 Tax=Burkholderia oklahomensis TaxID=342113 RepID=A0AAI8FN12_9BURK|nr:glycosyltransferase [Burkholderia oklahomensis]AIO66282.1 glycosyl transferases group 1 family protein [Burkholderia oklahomensis]AJX33786.1 glycosyl transferases group 1 family protein [Burkholderia oklahomensis C6786]AOI41390.1 glycosyl transferase family 1 [Burkholderia oklahomensis EO147]AOI44995.1 glycosyl transferase family 1 [Burkholderia oklahomensis C6786]KUY63879.1 glycosyl transferase family 1 [Burkholderia oklahomensis EO147]